MSKVKTLEEAFFALSEGIKEGSRAPNIKKYRPHEKQYMFHASTKKKKLYIGGNRSGKTTGGVCEAIWRATGRHPYRPDLNELGPTRGRVIAVDFINGVEKIIFPQFKQWIYPSALRGGSWETAYDKTLRTLYFTNGSFIEFMSYDQDLDKFAGTSRNWVHFDEEPPKAIYIENMARLMDTDGDFWITMTPVEGMTWIYDDLFEPNENNEDSPVEIIQINTEENPYLTANAIKSFADSVDDDEKQARLQGKFVQVGGRIYKSFDPTVGGLHVLREPVEKPKQRFKDWLWICALDHGLNNPTAVLWTAVNREGFAVTFKEHYRKEWTIDMHAAEIHKINQQLGRVPDLYVADPSIQNRNAVSGTSIHEEYIKFGIPFILGNPAVKDGIVRVKRYMNPTVRIDKETGLPVPKWRCTPNCSNLIWELKRYRWKTYSNKKLNYEHNNFEEPNKRDDHAADALRYAIMTRPDLAADGPTMDNRVDDIIDSLNVGGGLGVDIRVVKTSGPWNVADPNDLAGHPTWREGDSTISRNSDDWQYDEHMGGLY